MQSLQVDSVAYSGFPVKSLTKQINRQGGQWITAYRVRQQKRFKTVLSTASGQSPTIFQPPTNTPPISRETSGSISTQRYTLNKTFLLNHCFVNVPGDLCVADISGAGLEYYVSHGFGEFTNLVCVNASDNKLTLDAFTSFPNLEELEVALNDVGDFQLDHGGYRCLHSLNLSYNSITGLALIELGMLPSLRELHLTGNNIVALPVEMTRSFQTSGGTLQVRFPVLERLWLDDNKLSDQTTFATLAGLGKLRYLNLDNNEFYSIPYLKLLGPHTSEHALLDHTVFTPSSAQVSARSISSDLRPDNDITPPILICPPTEPVQTPPSTTEHSVCFAESEMARNQTFHKSADDADNPVNLPASKSTDESDHDVSRNLHLNVDSPVPPHAPSPGGSEPGQTSYPPPPQETEKVEATPTHIQAELSALRQNNGQSQEQPLRAGTVDVEGSFQQEPGDKDNSSSEGVVGLLQLTDMEKTIVLGENVDAMSVAPFPELECLSIVNNLLLTPEGVTACKLWPALKDLILHGNPFTQTRRGMPPLLQTQLVNECGIRVVRKKERPVSRYYIGSGAKEFKKISTALPSPIPKHPLPAIRDCPHTDIKTIGYSPSLSHTGTHSSPRSFSPASTDSMDSLFDESDTSVDQQGVFMTQLQGEELPDRSHRPLPPKSPVRMSMFPSPKEEYKLRKSELRNKFKDVPERYKGFEVLLETYNDPQVKIPTDIHSCVRALEYSLKHPVMLGGSGPTSTSSPSSSLTGTYLKKKVFPVAALPPPTHTHNKVREVRGVLDDIRTHCSAMETNLAQSLKPPPTTTTPLARRTAAQLQRDSKKLIAEMQACYDKVRVSSLKSVQSLSEMAI